MDTSLDSISKLYSTLQTIDNNQNASRCNPSLMNTPWSRESNGTLTYGLCPDTYISFTITLVFLIVYLITLVFSIVGVVWKRNSSYVSARNPIYLFFTLAASFWFVVVLTLRRIVSSKIFPCGLMTMGFFTFPPAIALPLIFRFFRAFFMYKINLAKTKLFESNNGSEQRKAEELMDQSVIQSEFLSESQESIQGNGGAELITKTDSFQVHGVNLQQVSNTVKGNQIQPSDENNNEGPSTNRTSSASVDDLDNDTISTTWSTGDMKDLSSLKMEMRKLQIYNFLVSTKFMGIVYLCSFIFGFIIWAILGGIDEGLNSSNDLNRIFLVESSMFEFRHGCAMTFYTVLTIGLEVLVYVVVEFIFLALCVKADKDTWGIKKESFIVITIQLIAGVLFIISGTIEVISELVDYYVPYGFFIWGYMYLELFICCALPVVRSILYDYNKMKNNDHDSNIERVLKNKKTFNIMLDFARRSYCTESLQCWKDIQRYKKSTKHRKKIANHILQAYLSINSPLELNMPKIEQCKADIISQLTDNPPANLFQQIQQHCLIDMTDLFERLKNSNKEFASSIQKV